MKNKIYLREQDAEIVDDILQGIEGVLVYGSRAKGTQKPFSDLDLCVKQSVEVDDKLLNRLRDAFQESNLPITVDLFDYHQMSEVFQQEVDKSGVAWDLNHLSYLSKS